MGTLTAVVRGRGSDADLMRAVRRTVAAADATVPADIELLDAAASRNTAPRRLARGALEVFSTIALLLAGIGVYGVLSFSVAQRTREIAVRAALGADRTRLVLLVFGNGAAVLGAGLVAGLAGAVAGAHLLQAMLFNVSPHDPIVLAAATAIIAAIGALAAVVPARRATRIDPIVALRED
jgi:putative ABC transport system permease protein